MRGEAVVTARVNWLMGEVNLEPTWGFGSEGERFEVEITGDPSVKTVFHGLHPESIASGLARNPGIVAAAMQCVNAIPIVCRAEPGIRTYLDLPSYHGKAAKQLGAARRSSIASGSPTASQLLRARAKASAAASRSRSRRPARTSCAQRAPRPTSTQPRSKSAHAGAASSP